MAREYTLEEQIAILEGFTTVDPQQFAVKNSILNRLRLLQDLRNKVQAGENTSDSKFVSALALALGGTSHASK